MTQPHFFVTPQNGEPCISLIGMAACGKSSVGQALAVALDWAHVDTDRLIEACYGVKLQDMTDNLPRDNFLNIEQTVIKDLKLNRSVISTGGSVIYREGSMEHLARLGVIIHINVSLPLILERIAKHPDRGLVIAPGQTVEELFAEREALYKKWALVSLDADKLSISQCADEIVNIYKTIRKT